MEEIDRRAGAGHAGAPREGRKPWRAPRLERASVLDHTNKKDTTPTDFVQANVHS